MTDKKVQVVWFKRDLRVQDHNALASAAARGPVLPLYVVEPDYWALDDVSRRQYEFLAGSIRDLRTSLKSIGASLVIRVGDTVGVLEDILGTHGKFDLHAHEETGNAWTFQRDKHVRRWCKAKNVTFTEHRQFGIVRGSDLDRNKWAAQWDAMMSDATTPIPTSLQPVKATSSRWPSAKSMGLVPDGIVNPQKPGRATAAGVLDGFLTERGQSYRTDMSSPLTGETGCSRLSPYIAMGSISMREIFHATRTRKEEIADAKSDEAKRWRQSLTSFIGRLHWHCHFMQKLETEPEIEFLPMARAYGGLRGDTSDPARLAAFATGATGYPFIDACMAYLRATGWINFRMRAMLMSFASYDLWLRWQDSGNVLARLFTDYEPGIHWPQSQMQSGVTGINAVRIYSPVKQGFDQDPNGDFTRRWVPALESIPGKSIHEPWNCQRKLNYPPRIVDHGDAVKSAKSAIYSIRSKPESREEAQQTFEKHGSRRGPRRRIKRRENT